MVGGSGTREALQPIPEDFFRIEAPDAPYHPEEGFLGDIPGLGNLFRNKGRTSEKAELLIFVTPRILQVAGSSR